MSNDTAKPLAEKGVFDKVLTATPVILTIVATFLVGQSSSEMTQAQYHRATASQNQSKVGDQWAFFQAKRIRGTSYEVTAELLSVNLLTGQVISELELKPVTPILPLAPLDTRPPQTGLARSPSLAP